MNFNLLSDRRDLERLMQGFRKMALMHEAEAMQKVTSDVFSAVYGEKVRQVGQVTPRNRILTSVLARLLEGPAPLRRMLIEKLILEAPRLGVLMEDDEALEGFVRKATVGVWHASCTCRMGAGDDPVAVTDNQGRVHGFQGLRVVDASIFPVVPCTNLNFPVMMSVEKIADTMLAED